MERKGINMRKFYKKDGLVYEFSQDGSQDHLISDQYTPMLADEIDRHINPENYLSNEEKEQLRLSQFKPLTRYQFLRCLLENGFKSVDIEAKILTIEDEMTRELTLLGFKEATNFVRTDESILAMQSVLNLTDERVDEMWEHALTL